MKYFTSDTHVWHRNILKYCNRPFDDVPHMNEMLIANWNSVVKPEDEVYHLGDVGFGSLSKTLAILERLNGKKYLVKGNHDYHCKKEAFQQHWEWIRDYYELRVQDESAENGKYRLLILCHYPLYTWNKAGRGSIMVHGHCHNTISKVNQTTRRIDVGVDNPLCNYTPLSYEILAREMANKTYIPVDHHDSNTNP